MAKTKKPRSSKTTLKSDLKKMGVIEKDLDRVKDNLQKFLDRVHILSWEPYLKGREGKPTKGKKPPK